MYFTINGNNYVLKDYNLAIMKRYYKYMTIKTQEGGSRHTRFWISLDGTGYDGNTLNSTNYTFDITDISKIDWLRGSSSSDYSDIELTFHN